MIKARGVTQALYDKLIHVSCLVQGVHYVIKEVRGIYLSVNKLMSSMKKVPIKCPNCVEIYYRKCIADIYLYFQNQNNDISETIVIQFNT